jgi:oxygen-dependent protoporphyrinogen oxidase
MGNDLDVAVVGGGISGLAAGWALACRGLRVRVFERRAAVGGRIASERAGGFLMEHGPNMLVTPAERAERLIRECGIAGARVERGPDVRHRFIVRGGQARALPLDPARFFTSGFFTLRGRLRFLAEAFIPPVPADETIAQFAARRFGREFLDYVVDPLVGGLQAGNPEGLSVASVFPRLKRLEAGSGSVIRALLGARLAGRAPSEFDPRRRQLISFREGMATLPRALAAALGDRVVTGAQVAGLRPVRAGFRLKVNGADVSAAAVVIALPAYAAARLIEPLDAGAAQAAGSIAHPPLAVVFLGYPPDAIRHPLDGLGVLMPRVERRGVLGMLFSSTLFPGRAPPGQAAITAYVGGAREPDLALQPAEALTHGVHQEMRALFRARLKPQLARVRYWRHGLPQPALGHGTRLARLRALEAAFPGLYLTGNYFGGASTAACIDEALGTAGRLIEAGCGTAASPAGRVARMNSGVTAVRPAA